MQEYRLKNDGDIDLKKCPAYEKPIGKKVDIKLVKCPAYIEKKKDHDIELKECPVYEKPSEQPDIKSVECPAYVGQKKHQKMSSLWTFSSVVMQCIVCLNVWKRRYWMAKKIIYRASLE